MTNQQQNIRLTREQLGVQIGDQIVMKGFVRYARIAEKIDGEELARDNANRLKQGRPAATAPYYHLVITSPEIISGQDTPLAKFYEQRYYKKEDSDIVSIDFESKTVLPIPYGQMTEDYTSYMEINDPGKNPAEGQEIYLVISAYGDKNDKTKNLGSTFDAIIYGPGEIKFYEGGDRLANFGKALNLTKIENPNFKVPERAVNTTPQESVQNEQPVQNQQPTQNEQPTQNAFTAQQQSEQQTTNAFAPNNNATAGNPFDSGATQNAGTNPFA